jgi:hypothetical protein
LPQDFILLQFDEPQDEGASPDKVAITKLVVLHFCKPGLLAFVVDNAAIAGLLADEGAIR